MDIKPEDIVVEYVQGVQCIHCYTNTLIFIGITDDLLSYYACDTCGNIWDDHELQSFGGKP